MVFLSMTHMGAMHIVRTHKGRGEGSSQMRTITYQGGGKGFQGYVHTQNNFFGATKSQNLFFCTKEAITLPFIIVHRKV